MGDEPLNVAKLHALESKVKVNYYKTTAEENALQYPEHYDVVTCMEMLVSYSDVVRLSCGFPDCQLMHATHCLRDVSG